MQPSKTAKVKPVDRGRRARLGSRVLILAAGVLFALAIAELVVANFMVVEGQYGDRPLPPYSAINTPWQQDLYLRRSKLWEEGDTETGYVRFDQELGWTFARSAESADGKGSSNDLGARGPREYGQIPQAGITRVLTFGDSFTYCYMVEHDETWQAQIEAEDPAIEVINFGVPSYGTDQALLRYRRCGQNLAARFAVMGVMLENIGRNVNRYRPIYFSQSGTLGIKPRFILEDDELVLVGLPYPDEGAALRAIGDGSVLDDLGEHEYWRDRPGVLFGNTFASFRLAAGFLAYLQRRPSSLWTARDEEPYQVTVAILEAFAREASAAGCEFTATLVFPTENDLDALLDGEEKYWADFLQDLNRRGLDFIDVSDALLAACRQAGNSSAAVFAGGHLNAHGNQIVSRILLAWLQERI